MDISKLAKKPQLARVEISDADIVEAYGDSIVFWMMDEIDIATYFNFYRLQQSEDSKQLNDLLRRIILNEDGKPALAEDEVFPVNITLAVLVAINNFLGKLNTKQEEKTTGQEQN